MKTMTDRFWTMERRAWLYGIVVATAPLLLLVSGFTPELVEQILKVASAILAVGGGTMALTNLTPNNVFKIGVEVDKGGE